MRPSASKMLPSSRPASEFTEQQLKQLRAQCIVFLAFRNEEELKKLHLEIALGGCPAQGGGGGGGGRRGAGGDDSGVSCAETSSSSQVQFSEGLPLPHVLPISSLRLSWQETEPGNYHGARTVKKMTSD